MGRFLGGGKWRIDAARAHSGNARSASAGSPHERSDMRVEGSPGCRYRSFGLLATCWSLVVVTVMAGAKFDRLPMRGVSIGVCPGLLAGGERRGIGEALLLDQAL